MTISLIIAILVLALLLMILSIRHLHLVQVHKGTEQQLRDLQLLTNTFSMRQRQAVKWADELALGRKVVTDLYKDRSQREQMLKNYYEQQLQFRNPKGMLKMVDKRLNGFVSSLAEEYTALSEKERMLLCLYMLRVSDTDICEMLDYSSKSLPTIKARLAKKLGLEQTAALQDKIWSLLEKD